MSTPLRVVLGLALAFLVVCSVILFLPPSVEGGEGPIADSPLDESELVARGEYLATAGNCASCHTAPDGAFMAGGLAFRTPFGVIHSTNITPDPVTGIGNWTERDFLNSMRHGVRPNGEHLYPAFPYTAFTRVTDADVAAIFAYLRSLPPVVQLPPENDLPFPFDQRALMAFWKLMFFEPGAFEPEAARSEEWNRGAYLVEGLAHCSACHSPRNLLGAERASRAFAGGAYVDRVPGGAHVPWSAPNLTPSDRGLGLWTREDLTAYLKTARNDFLESYGPMNEVVMNSTRHLAMDDLDAMATYLESLPVVDEPAGAVPDAQVMGRGRTVYNLHCGTCHLPTGEGDPEMAPKLNAGSLVVQSADPASMLNAIMYSPEGPDLPPPPRWRHAMEEFQYKLDDEEIAAVATYIRQSWSNSAGAVTPEQVRRQRE